MTTLREALNLTPRPLLLFMGRQRHLSYSSNLPKAELVHRLAQTLADPAHLQAALALLGKLEQQVLATLLATTGRLARRYLSPRYGQIRPPRLLPKISQSDTEPLSPLERLLTLGLIFYNAPTGDCFIPTDLILLMNERIANGEAANGEAVNNATISQSPLLSRHSPTDLLCHDLALLLGLLHQDDVHSLHGRWLPPRTLAAWGRGCLVSPAFPHVRSELQTGRRRFLHYEATDYS